MSRTPWSVALAPAAALTRVAVPFYAAMAVVALLWMAAADRLGLLGPEPGSLLGSTGLADGLLANVGLGLALALAVVVGTQWSLARHEWARFLEDQLRAVLRGLRPSQAVVLGLVSGIGEELLFRGALQPALVERLGVGPGLVVTSLVFAAAHIGPDRRFLTWTAFSAVMGLLLGGLLLATGSVIAPICLHVGVNALNLILEAWEQAVQAPVEGPSGHG